MLYAIDKNTQTNSLKIDEILRILSVPRIQFDCAEI